VRAGFSSIISPGFVASQKRADNLRAFSSCDPQQIARDQPSPSQSQGTLAFVDGRHICVAWTLSICVEIIGNSEQAAKNASAEE
jgi:hypothetical protein